MNRSTEQQKIEKYLQELFKPHCRLHIVTLLLVSAGIYDKNKTNKKYFREQQVLLADLSVHV